MDIQPWTDRETWDVFVASQRRAPFQQTWAWGEFKHQVGVEIIRLAVVSGSKIIGIAQVFYEPWHFGQSTLTGFHAPLIDASLPVPQYQEALGLLMQNLVDEAKKRNVMSLHLEPPIELCNESLFKQFEVQHKLRHAPAIQPLDTLMLDLRQDEDRLLAGMHEKTRYNIRLAEKKGVHIEVASAAEQNNALEEFISLNKQTAVRDRFQSHGPGYYRRLAEYLPPGVLKVYVAKFENRAIAANLVVHFGDMATYVHGASGNANRNVMAPHLLQWRQILDAKILGKQWYDFFGIETPQRKRASRQGGSWAGITRFKQGFGGQVISYLSAYELPVRLFWYRLVRAARIIRR
jgi:lipid II:glycine glycyltransferase (peptidoglycan interpeptide bridge formation enzyme)